MSVFEQYCPKNLQKSLLYGKNIGERKCNYGEKHQGDFFL